MSIFKYLVTNNEGKKLTGTIEANSIELAKNELNNLGFSTLSISETQEKPKENKTLSNKFIFEAIDKNSKIIKGSIESETEINAKLKLEKEYDFNIYAIWAENASEEEINNAKILGQKYLNEKTSKEYQTNKSESEQEKIEDKYIKDKIDFILNKVSTILTKFQSELDADVKQTINKKIDKILRIRNSSNKEYIVKTAEDLLLYIQSQEKTLEEKGYHDKNFELKLETKSLLKELKKDPNQKTLSEDISSKIQNWKKKHNNLSENNILTKLFNYLDKTFTVPIEIKNLKEEISNLKKQKKELFLIQIKEKDKNYKEKIKNSIKTIKNQIAIKKLEIKEIKEKTKKLKNSSYEDSNLKENFILLKEVNSIFAWIIGFYTTYYIIIQIFSLKQGVIFPYLFTFFFLIHVSIAYKLLLFKNNKITNIIIPISAAIILILSIVNL